MEELLKQMNMVYEIMGKKEFSQAVVTMLWNIYTEAKLKGFSDEQAMAITLNFSKSPSPK